MLSLVIHLSLVPTLWLQLSVVTAWLSVILLAAWLVYRFAAVKPEIVRKIVHIGTGNVILLAWWLNVPAIMGITASIVAGIIALLSYRFPFLPGINSVGRQSFGTFFYAASMGILFGWFWHIQQPQYAAIGIMVMAWGDGLAALIGQRFGKHQYTILGSTKSWEGSLSMAIVTFAISYSILLITPVDMSISALVSLTIAVTATGLETISFWGIDNLTVPLSSATLAFTLVQCLS